jgi:histidinol-phosphate/aromatic aminotransferase/cobyric acid decarboxylase-like protein
MAFAGEPAPEAHGGNRGAVARQLGCRPDQVLDASASLVPFGPPLAMRLRLLAAQGSSLRDYPDRTYTALRGALAGRHQLDPAWVLPGNGAAELITWAARDAAAEGPSLLPTPGFADYRRALACWQGAWVPWPLPLHWEDGFPQPFPTPAKPPAVLWLTNPHNPTGQLWSRRSLEPLLAAGGLVIADEAFLPLVPGGERQSLVPLLARHPNLVVLRSLTKLYGIAGVRLGYALAHPDRLARWAAWRDPWPVNGLAAALGPALIADGAWEQRVQDWVARERSWLVPRLAAIPGLTPLPSATNFLLLRSTAAGGGAGCGEAPSLEPLRLALQNRHRILLRDCRSFDGLDGRWLRLALLDRRGHRRLLRALTLESGQAP